MTGASNSLSGYRKILRRKRNACLHNDKIPFVEGRITIGPWQNLTLVECDTRDRNRDIVFQVMGE